MKSNRAKDVTAVATNLLYLRVYDALCERIRSGELALGARLPGERELTREFSVSAITVKRALSMLADEGLVVRIPGRGTFVRGAGKKDPGQGEPALIGVILEHVASPFGLTMLYELDRLIQLGGRHMVVRFSYCEREKEVEEIGFLLSMGVQGLIIMPSHGLNYNPEILKLVLSGFPVVLVDKKLDGIDVPSVRTDNASAMRELVHYLVSSGKRNIALITTAEGGATSTRERKRGFYQGINEAGLSRMPECQIAFNGAIESREVFDETAGALAQYLMKHQAQLDALVCSEYGIVLKLMRAARDIHLDIEKCIEVCSIDEDDQSPAGYRFTHMKQDERAIAAEAVRLLENRIHGEAVSVQDSLIPAIFRRK